MERGKGGGGGGGGGSDGDGGGMGWRVLRFNFVGIQLGC